MIWLYQHGLLQVLQVVRPTKMARLSTTIDARNTCNFPATSPRTTRKRKNQVENGLRATSAVILRWGTGCWRWKARAPSSLAPCRVRRHPRAGRCYTAHPWLERLYIAWLEPPGVVRPQPHDDYNISKPIKPINYMIITCLLYVYAVNWLITALLLRCDSASWSPLTVQCQNSSSSGCCCLYHFHLLAAE